MAASDLETLLQLIGQAAPGSWHPRIFAEQHNIPLRAINSLLEQLHLDGLITRGTGDTQAGPGVTLTPRGQRVLQDPQAMARLGQGLAIDPGDRGGIVRELLRRPFKPIVTWTLIALNVAVFAYGLYLASQVDLTRPFLGGLLETRVARGVWTIRHYTGAILASDLLRGQWWRLITACFVHMGLIHILMNMWVLRGLGGLAEQMWGRARFLTIYLLAGFGGSCLAMVFPPVLLVNGRAESVLMGGASGAICGLIGAEPVWVLFNWKYLPRSMVSRWRNVFLSNLALLIFISLVPGVSGLGHLGGAVVGAIAALLLHWHRFGSNPWRWLGIVALVPLPFLCFAAVKCAQQTNPTWKALERPELMR